MPKFQRSSTCITNPTKITEIICGFIKKVAVNLQITMDFDMTLRRSPRKGKRCPTCHNIIDNHKLVAKMNVKKGFATKEKYYVVKIDSVFTTEEKYPFMVERHAKAHSLLVK